MQTYSEELKARIIAQMLPPQNRSISDIVRETGIPKDTLYTWRSKHRSAGEATEAKVAGAGGLNSQDKFHLVVESASMNELELGEFCRRRGVFPEQLAGWREACLWANEVRPRREDSSERRDLMRRNAELESELRQKEKALAEAAALLMLQKKVRALWMAPEDASLTLGSGRR